MTNFKTITNDEVFKLISGGSLNHITRVIGGIGENNVFSTSTLRTSYKEKIKTIRDKKIDDFDFKNIIDKDGLLKSDENNDDTPIIISLESINDIFLSTRELLTDINRRQTSNLNYESNQITLVKEVMTNFVNILSNYLMPIIHKAYVPNAENILGNIEVNIQPSQINNIYLYLDDIETLHRNGYFNFWSNEIFENFIQHFKNCRQTLNEVFQYYINFILNTRNEHNQQVYTTNLTTITNGRFKKDISYYQSLVDRVLELIINKLQIIRQSQTRRITTSYRRQMATNNWN